MRGDISHDLAETAIDKVNLSGLSIRTSMQNLESVAQKMADLPLDTPEPPHPCDAPDKKIP